MGRKGGLRSQNHRYTPHYLPRKIVYGRLGNKLGFSTENDGKEVPSIWKKDLMKRFHEDDIVEKLALELQFITFVKNLPKECRQDYYLQHVLRMRDANGKYVYATHRIYYLRYDNSGNVLLALCLYTIATPDQRRVEWLKNNQ